MDIPDLVVKPIKTKSRDMLSLFNEYLEQNSAILEDHASKGLSQFQHMLHLMSSVNKVSNVQEPISCESHKKKGVLKPVLKIDDKYLLRGKEVFDFSVKAIQPTVSPFDRNFVCIQFVDIGDEVINTDNSSNSVLPTTSSTTDFRDREQTLSAHLQYMSISNHTSSYNTNVNITVKNNVRVEQSSNLLVDEVSSDEDIYVNPHVKQRSQIYKHLPPSRPRISHNKERLHLYVKYRRVLKRIRRRNIVSELFPDINDYYKNRPLLIKLLAKYGLYFCVRDVIKLIAMNFHAFYLAQMNEVVPIDGSKTKEFCELYSLFNSLSPVLLYHNDNLFPNIHHCSVV